MAVNVAQIEIRWTGKKAAVREAIEEAVDRLFYDLTMSGDVTAGESNVRFLRDEG